MAASRSWTIAVLLVVGTARPLPAATAAAPAPREGDRVEEHVVAPGETLEGLTGQHLGDPGLWRENWRLNPQIANPHKIEPGARIRLIVERRLPPVTARVERVHRRVEEQAPPADWSPARPGDQLGESHSLRTYPGAAAALRFKDGAELVVTEDSLILLREVAQDPRGVSREKIELVSGQADLVAKKSGSRASDVELVLGDATARPAPDASGRTNARVRQSEQGAGFMAYGGRATVSAAGKEVQVAPGMGTTVEKGKEPATPEKLLAAPRPLEPVAGAALEWSNPGFRWSEVKGATGYTVEVCTDNTCRAALQRVTGLAATSWRSEEWLPRGNWFWRVTARAASGLDGYPGAPTPITILSPYPDREPPVAVVVQLPRANTPAGGSGSYVAGSAALSTGAIPLAPDRAIRVPAGSGIAIRGVDDRSGIERIGYRWNGGQWLWSSDPAGVALPIGRGGELEVLARDRSGRESAVWKARVEYAREPGESSRVRITPER